ncbi:MAG: hypothetical protein AVDCRST_MAG39-2776 [uncultured Sphingomonadaceae bacterium]|uniref:Uncharacterized protein n=1 Tax=uncultured Sphingomonadaceae bacterium TaxID=169976 RepID=A0A6J4TES1_9SPHN|nr:MAG: hypothetical protein AVDCRST_MAG39-2776 [uncultured Sphingomonadaceae bacterium]
MKRIGILLFAATACATPPSVAENAYVARGQEPGWIVRIAGGRISYTGDYGEVRIDAPAGEPRTTFNGCRHETASADGRSLLVDVTRGRCNDEMSGFGYADQVLVIADGRSFWGCGGARRPEWDN